MRGGSEQEFSDYLAGEKTTGEDVERMVKTPGFQFLLRVVLPCVILHKQFPGHLFRKARSGDGKSLSQLLAIDKAVIFEPRIQALSYRMAQTEPTRYKRVIAQSLHKSMPKIESKKIKAGMAGLLALIAEPLGGLRAPEIKELFDSVHRVIDGGLIDTDIPEEVYAFPKSLQRERAEWVRNLNLPPGQK